MKYILLFSSCLLNILLITAQNNEERNLSTFSKIDVGDGIIVILEKSDNEHISIQTKDIETNKVLTSIESDVLKIRIDTRSFKKPYVKVTLEYTSLIEINASSKADITSTSIIKQDSIKTELFSGAQVYLTLDVKYFESRIVEGSLLSLDGNVKKQVAYIASGATLFGFKLKSEETIIKAVTGGIGKINVTKNLDANASTGAYILYKGNPEQKVLKPLGGAKIQPSKD